MGAGMATGSNSPLRVDQPGIGVVVVRGHRVGEVPGLLPGLAVAVPRDSGWEHVRDAERSQPVHDRIESRAGPGCKWMRREPDHLDLYTRVTHRVGREAESL